MKCEKAKYLMIEAIGGEALWRERFLLGLHRIRCSGCRSEWKELKRLKRLMADLREPLPVDLRKAFGVYKVKRFPSGRLIASLATAAGIAILLLFKGFFPDGTKGLSSKKGEIEEVVEPVILSYAEKAYATLPFPLEEEGNL